jgi:two-component system, LuxR family, sensor kinase FixL
MFPEKRPERGGRPPATNGAHDSRRKRVEEELRQSEARLAGIIESAMEAIVSVDEQQRIILFNPAAEMMYQRSAAEVIGQTLAILIPQDVRPVHEKHIADFHRTGKTRRLPGALGEVRGVRADGTIFPAEISISKVATGGSAVFTAIVRDITERKLAELALQESEERFRGLFETMTLGGAIHDLIYDDHGVAVDYRIVSINPAFESCCGISVEAAAGRRASELFGTGKPPFIEHFRRVASTGTPASFEFHTATLGRHFHASIFSLRRGRLVTLLEDTSERRRLETLASQRQAELIRTAGIITMGEMASTIAHELNQPLTSIANYAEGCLMRLRAGTLGTQDLAEVLGAIGREAVRAADTVRAVRGFVQKREFAPAEIDINNSIREVARFAEVQSCTGGIALQLDLDCGLPRVVADEVLVQVVLMNLIKNGVEAMSGVAQDLPRLSLRSRLTEGTVTVSVHDTGRGIAREHLDAVFDAFFTTRPEGTGLGLAISRSIVESHGGRLWVSTERDAGSAFHFTLRVAEGTGR